MLGRLVGQDYVKLRGPLLLAFAVALSDESDTVRDTATETLEALSATKKLTALFHHSFLQLMMQLNRLHLPGAELDASLACLTIPGEDKAARRQVCPHLEFEMYAHVYKSYSRHLRRCMSVCCLFCRTSRSCSSPRACTRRCWACRPSTRRTWS